MQLYFKTLLAPALAIFSPQQLGAVVGGALLTLWIIIGAVHAALQEFSRDRNYARFIVYLGGTIVIGFGIVRVTYRVVDKVVDTTQNLNASNAKVEE